MDDPLVLLTPLELQSGSDPRLIDTIFNFSSLTSGIFNNSLFLPICSGHCSSSITAFLRGSEGREGRATVAHAHNAIRGDISLGAGKPE